MGKCSRCNTVPTRPIFATLCRKGTPQKRNSAIYIGKITTAILLCYALLHAVSHIDYIGAARQVAGATFLLAQIT
jgi:hypothetical protein